MHARDYGIDYLFKKNDFPWAQGIALAPPPVEKKRYGLILGGGTARGAVQVPIVRELRRLHGAPAGIVGVSIGAIHALLLGEDRYDDLVDEWLAIDGVEDFASKQVDVWNGLRSLAPLRRRLEARNAGAKIVIPTWVGLVDVADEAYRSVALHTLGLQDRQEAALGSATQPFLLGDATFKGRPVMDGGAGGHVLGPLPNWADMEEIHIISCSPLGPRRRRTHRPEDMHGPWKAAEIAFELLMGRQADEDVEDLRDAYAAHVPTYLYSPDSIDAVGKPFDAERTDIQMRFKTGKKMFEQRERLSKTGPFRRPR